MIHATLKRPGAAALLPAAFLAALVVPGDADAQLPGRIGGEGFLWGPVAAPGGEFNDHVELAGGLGLGGLLYLNDQRYAALRLEGNLVIYGSETIRTPLSPTVPFVDVDVRTTNSILSAGVGPQVFLTRGAIRPYVFGTVGLSYFVTETSVQGDYDEEPFASTTNFDDLNLSLGGGGGLSVGFYQGEVALNLDLSVAYSHNGLTEYLTKGDLRRLPRGGWVADPILSDANLVTYRVGISVGPGW